MGYEYRYYTDHTVAHGGHLTFDRRTHALFHYYILCQKLLEKAGKSIEDQTRYEGQPWQDKHYGNIAKGVALQYGLVDPSEFLKPEIKGIVEKEIQRMQFPAPDPEYWEVEPGKVVMV